MRTTVRHLAVGLAALLVAAPAPAQQTQTAQSRLTVERSRQVTVESWKRPEKKPK
jgi:hypothetical protein